MSKWFSLYRSLNRYALRVLRRNLIVFGKTWKTNVAFNFIEPLLYLGAMGWGLGTFVGEINGLPYVRFIAPGIIASSAMWAASSECTYESYIRMHYQKIFHAITATPVSLEEVVAGELLTGAFKSVLYGSVILTVIAALGLVPSAFAVFVPIVLLLSGLAFAILGLVWTGLVPKIDSFSYFFTLVVTPMFLFSGIFFPLDALPAPARAAAGFLPLYHIVRLLRSLVLGQVSFTLLFNALWLIVFVLLLFPLPLVLMRRRLVR